MITCQSKPYPRRIVVDFSVTSSSGRIIAAYLSLGDWISQRSSGNAGRLVWIDGAAHCVALTTQTMFRFSHEQGDSNE